MSITIVYASGTGDSPTVRHIRRNEAETLCGRPLGDPETLALPVNCDGCRTELGKTMRAQRSEPADEYFTKIGGMYISVDKDGGGTLGRSYDGDWTVSVQNGPVYVYDNETLHTGTPKTHAQVARMAFEFASARIGGGE